MIAHQYQRRRLLEKFTKDHTNDDDDRRQVLVIAHMALRQGDLKDILSFCHVQGGIRFKHIYVV
jgi:hypothetical protein